MNPTTAAVPSANSSPATAVILFGHGSRTPGWNSPLQAALERLHQQRPDLAACCAYLEILEPSLPDAVDMLANSHALEHVHVLPVFLGTGKHVAHDLPALIAQAAASHPDLTFSQGALLGERPEFIHLLSDMACADALLLSQHTLA